MDLTAISTRVLERLDDSGGVFYLTSEVTSAINKAQRIFAFLSHCIERSATLTLVADQYNYKLKDDSDFATFLLPLRAVCNGARLQSRTVGWMDAKNTRWRLKRDTPTDYAMLGFDLLFCYPTPDASGFEIDLTFVAEPVALSSGSDVPEIFEEDHPALIDFAIYWLRLKEGGLESQNTMPMLKRFLEAASMRAAAQRAQGLAQKFDRIVTFDLASVDQAALYRMKLDRVPPLKVMEAKT